MTTKLLGSALVIATLGFLSACSSITSHGGDDGGGPPPPWDPPAVDAGAPSLARQLFDDNIYPILASKCAGCHTAGHPAGNTNGFVDPDPARAYDRVVGFTAVVGDFSMERAPIVAKIGNGHQALSYTTNERARFAAWLEQERLERGIEDMPTPGGVGMLAHFSGCLTYENFLASDMASSWSNIAGQNGNNCASCHPTGANGFVATHDEMFFFKVITQHSAYLQQYFSVNHNLSPVAVDVNTSIVNVATQQPPHEQHPRFETAPGLAASNRLLQSTNALMAAGQCGPPTLID